MITKFFFAVSLGITTVFTSQAAFARPEIASGDRLISTNFQGCLTRADDFIRGLNIESDSGEIDRTGYFEDGSFRILCYGTGTDSMVIVFASHENSIDVASSFVQMALDALAEEAGAVTDSRDTPVVGN